MTTVAILQPGYMPWLGFFEQMQRCDLFVYYDDVQFDKHGWRNRNRIKGPDGKPHWLTVPVFHKGQGKPRVMDVRIDNELPWAKKHIGTIRQFYAGAPFLSRYLPELESLLCRDWERLIDLDLAVVAQTCSWLGLTREIHRSSELGIQGEQSERLLNHCLHFGASKYISGSAARDYLDTDLFSRNAVQVEWQDYVHPVYPQLHGEFLPLLSTLDLLLNVGDEGLSVLSGRRVE